MTRPARTHRHEPVIALTDPDGDAHCAVQCEVSVCGNENGAPHIYK
jgi:hypothetical protein